MTDQEFRLIRSIRLEGPKITMFTSDLVFLQT